MLWNSLLFKNNTTVNFYFNVSILVFFFVVEEDSDEIKIGTSCKNGGCSKVYTVKFVCVMEVNFYF